MSTDSSPQERYEIFGVEELKVGRSCNRATDDGYVDPHLRPLGLLTTATGGGNGGDQMSADQAVEMGLWSLMRVMRAHAQNDKLYPRGRV